MQGGPGWASWQSAALSPSPGSRPSDPDQPWAAEDGGALELYPQGKGAARALPAARWPACQDGQLHRPATRAAQSTTRALLLPRRRRCAPAPHRRHPPRAGRGPHRHAAAPLEHNGLLPGAAGLLLPLNPGGGQASTPNASSRGREQEGSCGPAAWPRRHRPHAPLPLPHSAARSWPLRAPIRPSVLCQVIGVAAGHAASHAAAPRSLACRAPCPAGAFAPPLDPPCPPLPPALPIPAGGVCPGQAAHEHPGVVPLVDAPRPRGAGHPQPAAAACGGRHRVRLPALHRWVGGCVRAGWVARDPAPRGWTHTQPGTWDGPSVWSRSS